MNNLYLILREKLKKFILFFLLKLNFGNTDIIFDIDKNDKLFETINSSFLKALSGDTNLPEWILKLDGMSGVKFRSFMNFIFNNNNNFNLNYLEIGSYPFFHAGKLGVFIVIRSESQNKIDVCNSQILEFVKKKNITIVDR